MLFVDDCSCNSGLPRLPVSEKFMCAWMTMCLEPSLFTALRSSPGVFTILTPSREVASCANVHGHTRAVTMARNRRRGGEQHDMCCKVGSCLIGAILRTVQLQWCCWSAQLHTAANQVQGQPMDLARESSLQPKTHLERSMWKCQGH